MNRLVRTAAAVTAFGLAAALAVPAQAEVRYDTARYKGQGGGTTAGIPVSGLLGGVVGGKLVSGLLGGVTQAKPGARPAGRVSEVRPGARPAGRMSEVRPGARPAGRMSEAELDAAHANRRKRATTPNAAEDVTRQNGPLPELSPIANGLTLGGGGLTESLPVPVVPDAARLAQPAAPSVANGTTLLPATGSSVADLSRAAAKTMNSTTKGVDSLSAGSVVTGLSQAAGRALPHAGSGRLSPVIGQVAPSEIAPVVEALPGATRAASMDGLTPLVEDASGFVSTNATKAGGTYSDVLTALGWTTDALTSSVRDSWVRN
ncbi:hypothetical protein [Nonomuraea sp. NPDC049400]|uniref:hypothetical protein n=1 Tax=Nonomuraea sp. NPDC049400 TaxID=3364352 RepID=UPI0037A6FED6